jgi:hypothetical protein
MTEWYEKGYPGAPMVPVLGFPRPLYPPDANRYGKQPSMDGPDVVAYKRTVSRAGRWPWRSFDDAYSNSFAHGASGNVAETGVAGVQRQQHVDATGWLGRTTFNTLRSIVIPTGLPHAGEHAMDSLAADLIDDAWHLFGGPRAEPVERQRDRARTRALAREGAARHRRVARGLEPAEVRRLVRPERRPWCAIFTSWAYVQAAEGRETPSFAQGSRYSYVPYIVGDARAGLHELRTVDDPLPGDLVCYDFGGDGVYDHVGLFDTGRALTASRRSRATRARRTTSTAARSCGARARAPRR